MYATMNEVAVPRLRKCFQFGADEIETILPEIHFKPGTGSQDLALSAISKVLGLNDAKRDLETLFPTTRTTPSLDPLVTLGNIRRWALEGLRDDSLLSLLEMGPLVAPDPAAYADREPAARKTKASRSVTARQARCVLANAFIGNCMDVMADGKDPWNVGGLDFREMICDSIGVGRSKMECLLAYFETCATLEGTQDDDRTICFDAIRFVPLRTGSFDGDCSETSFVGEGVVLHAGTMESPTRRTSAFVNFANANYGYGRFINSCTQEEILLMCCPELAVGMLFIGKMKDNEVVNVSKVRRFCKYSGYLNSFQCLGPVSENEVPPIATVLTLDACYERHFTEAMLWRDVSKAYYSFLELAEKHEGEGRPIVSTGKWGCGAFGGSAAHKMLQQALAAGAVGVDLEFSSFGGHEGCDRIIAALGETQPNVGKVKSLLQSCKSRGSFVDDAIKFLHEDNEGRSSWKGPIDTLADMLRLV